MSDIEFKNVDFWTFNKKAQVVRAIADGQISASEVRDRYGVSYEELRSWIKLLRDSKGDPRSLCATKIRVWNPVKRPRS